MAEMLVDSNRRQVCKKHITENKRYKYKKYKIEKPKMTDVRRHWLTATGGT